MVFSNGFPYILKFLSTTISGIFADGCSSILLLANVGKSLKIIVESSVILHWKKSMFHVLFLQQKLKEQGLNIRKCQNRTPANGI